MSTPNKEWNDWRKYANGKVPDLILSISILLKNINDKMYTEEEKIDFNGKIQLRMHNLANELKSDDSWNMLKIKYMIEKMWGEEMMNEFFKQNKQLKPIIYKKWMSYSIICDVLIAITISLLIAFLVLPGLIR